MLVIWLLACHKQPVDTDPSKRLGGYDGSCTWDASGAACNPGKSADLFDLEGIKGLSLGELVPHMRQRFFLMDGDIYDSEMHDGHYWTCGAEDTFLDSFATPCFATTIQTPNIRRSGSRT